MKNTIKVAYFALALVLGFSTAACQDNGGGKIVNSAEALKEYLDSQSANSPDKPIKVAMNTNNLVFKDITTAITSSGKYVSLDLSGSPITAVPDYAFVDMDTGESCTGLIGIILPNSVTSIGFVAFARCTGLKSIIIPDSVTSIGDAAFSGCISLKNVTIPVSVTSIGDAAFADCNDLTAINVANNNTAYSSQAGVLYNKDKTTLLVYPGGKTGTFTIPDSVTSIESRAFASCTGLVSVTIPDKRKMTHFTQLQG